MNSKTPYGNRIYYDDAELIGWTLPDGKHISPKEMKQIFEHYKEILTQHDYQEARSIERERQLPRTWLTSVVSGIIRKANSSGDQGLSNRLKTEFKDRGFRPTHQTNHIEQSVRKS
jgi:hypothetical protein